MASDFLSISFGIPIPSASDPPPSWITLYFGSSFVLCDFSILSVEFITPPYPYLKRVFSVGCRGGTQHFEYQTPVCTGSHYLHNSHSNPVFATYQVRYRDTRASLQARFR